MGRHSSDTKNYHLAGWMWVASVAVIAILALAFGWNALHSSNEADSSQQHCADGDYNLTVWSSENHHDTAHRLVDNYNGDQHIVRDSCVRAEVKSMTDQQASASISQKKNLTSVWIPDDAQAAITAITKSGLKLSSDKVAVVDGAPILTFGSGAIEEMKARAGTDFSSAIGDGGDAQIAAVSDIRNGTFTSDSSASHGTNKDTAVGNKQSQSAQSSSPQDVTFLLDTSNAMGVMEKGKTRLDVIRESLSEKMLSIGKNKGHVGLWNYSSPLNPGVKNPFRANVDISVKDDGTISAARLNQLGLGGSAYTYDSIMATYRSASYAAANSSVTNHRMVLITASSNQGGANSLDQAIAAIKELNKNNPVQLDIVTLGDSVDVSSMKELAEVTGGKVYAAKDSANFADTLEEALS
ncbi:VWA domain-containing protein [Corynebacterium anserum]|uniref:VWA domain-containing protein n=1 Tax=Corynebacterium anserum TaxID=2684406 RepID=A0A7G7YN99_9CORY|nr:VWA domain-containing protein [Corynebacterium anserum]MBC2681518.1 VWA domain-containing protein [Corynebacterium anserum]QNH95969.1 VWA domain-containing protein [Corynebacterium anserum]